MQETMEKKPHLSPKHPFYRQPPRSGLEGKDEEISHKHNDLQEKPHKW